MKQLSVCFVYLVLLSGCISRGGKGVAGDDEGTGLKPPYRIALEHAIDNPTPIGISEIGESISYIPLETSGRSLLGKVNNIALSDSMIFVSDINWRLLAFDRQGKFLRQIGRIGNGPGEHIHLFEISLSPDGRRMLFLAGDRGVFEYDLMGKFFKNYKMPENMGYVDMFVPMNEDLFVFTPLNTPAEMDPHDTKLFISDLDGNVEREYKMSYKRESGRLMLPSGPLYAVGSDIRHKELTSDTLYTVGRDSLTTYAFFDLGNKTMPAEGYILPAELARNPERFFESYRKFYFVGPVFETAGVIYASLDNYSDEDSLYFFFDKQTGEMQFEPFYSNSINILIG